ncbi:MAG: phosphatidylinositol-specific phospholipase C domain-containing protein [Clostridia bacterium]|nr:phosphatidylinositol-specific phospholipase C domain-containing protein [Clostridia bacterium]
MSLNNWMKNIGDEKSLKDINIPATHDSTTKFCDFSLFSSCQSFTIREQLYMGVRCFDIRVNGMKLVHAFCKCKESRFGKQLQLLDVVSEMLMFLHENPSETVMMLFKMDSGENSARCLEMLFKFFIENNEEAFFTENRIPALGEIRGKIVLIRRTDSLRDEAGIDFTMMPDHGGRDKTTPDVFSPDGKDMVLVQDRYNLTRTIKWEKAVKPLLENESEALTFNFLSTAGLPIIPRFNSKYINKEFLAYPLEKGKKYGVLFFDFVTPVITEKLINTN